MSKKSRSRNRAYVPRYAGNMRTLRHITREQIIDLAGLTPPDAASVGYFCNCGNYVGLPWHEDFPIEVDAPLIGKISARVTNSFYLICNRCKNVRGVPIPVYNHHQGNIYLYGDETAQSFENDKGLFYCYAFVGCTGPDESILVDKLKEIKSLLRPNMKPESWVLHVKEIRSPQWRASNHVECSTEFVNHALNELLTCIGSLSHTFKFVSIIPPIRVRDLPKNENPISTARDIVLTAALYHTVWVLTYLGLDVYHNIEAQYSSNNNEIDWFVERVFRGLRYKPSFLWACHQRHVSIPVTLPKGSHPLLEIADLLAFTVQRYFLRTSQGRDTEYPLEQIDYIRWSVFLGKGVSTYDSIGFPWNSFFADIKNPKSFKWSDIF